MFEFAEPAMLDEELVLVRSQIRRYVEERIVPEAEDWEQTGEIPRQVFRDLGSLGVLGMRHPVEYGGGGLGALSSVILAEELSRSSFAAWRAR
ncbi:acyl-CoA dehydrogenase family protein [Bradyrhizobium sp. Lot11]